ncbi:hypothetical protein [Litorihabitans aurantiacus]|uniref:Uncharacterized protein n=1 Tax=Litorihabitans aurantiacus TaxID=1930061 RepID=A0AA37XG01_9MICO|nr:hypothetical protein [Litorihabitans aurantiacus]GMA32505.1 hypothetical protein GCM10025875_24970 [Litorihabitans aurantiacus]
MTPISLDGLDFHMISSTSSVVDAEAPTRFHYRQEGNLVWGRYTGDTVTQGRFVGEATAGRISISFAHASVTDGSVVRGGADSVVERREDGRIYLVEAYEIDGVPHSSVCVESPPD